MKKILVFSIFLILGIILIPMHIGLKKFERKELESSYEEEWNFIVTSDLHSGFNVFSEIFEDIEREDFDFLFINGDIVNLGTSGEYYRISNFLSDFDFPIYTSVGNHENWLFGKNLYNKVFGDYYYSFVYNNVTFIVIDSSLGYVDDVQFAWIEEELESVLTEYITREIFWQMSRWFIYI